MDSLPGPLSVLIGELEKLPTIGPKTAARLAYHLLAVSREDASQLAEACLRILGDSGLKQRLERNAYAYGRETAWPRVGKRMLGVLRSIASNRLVIESGRSSLVLTVLDGGQAPAASPEGARDHRSDPLAEVTDV